MVLDEPVQGVDVNGQVELIILIEGHVANELDVGVFDWCRMICIW